jgi:hypothetical protein
VAVQITGRLLLDISNLSEEIITMVVPYFIRKKKPGRKVVAQKAFNIGND